MKIVLFPKFINLVCIGIVGQRFNIYYLPDRDITTKTWREKSFLFKHTFPPQKPVIMS